jgi:hypothetical protein
MESGTGASQGLSSRRGGETNESVWGDTYEDDHYLLAQSCHFACMSHISMVGIVMADECYIDFFGDTPQLGPRRGYLSIAVRNIEGWRMSRCLHHESRTMELPDSGTFARMCSGLQVRQSALNSLLRAVG